MKSRLNIFPLIALSFIVGIFLISDFVYAATTSDVNSRRAQLKEELKNLEKEIEVQRKVLQKKQRETVSLERDVAIFNANISKAKLDIRVRNITINKLGRGISSKASTISDLAGKLYREKQSLSQLIRKTNEIDVYSTIEVILGNKNLSELFIDLDSFDSVELALQDSFKFIENTKNSTKKEKISLENKQAEQVELRSIQNLQKSRLEDNKFKKKKLLKITKGREEIYQKIIKDKEKSAATIRTELFTLQGSKAIPFAKALEYANLVSKRTDVRPALILGIIAEESNLGANVGTGNWRTDMKAPRDTKPFLAITSRLGLNPDTLPVSKKPWYGWGGAMGPAQFIPSTWVLYEKRIAKATGHNPPNPWDPYDAFMASAILLMDNGADKGTYASERLAALRYLAGWRNAKKSAYAFYGDDVMSLAAKYQKQINILERR